MGACWSTCCGTADNADAAAAAAVADNAAYAAEEATVNRGALALPTVAATVSARQRPRRLARSHSYHGNGDAFRTVVESSWHLKLSILTLFAANNNSSVNNNGKAAGRRTEWVQLSGHSGAFSVASPWSILKRRDPGELRELQAYKQLMEDAWMRQFAPTFYREVQQQGEHFLELEDLTQRFSKASIMDVKMGCRTFLETDADNPALRPDLYQKMLAVDPTEPTDEEHKLQAITKLRYMRFREEASTTVAMGFRVEAIRTHHPKSCALYSQKLKTVKTESEVKHILHYFCAFNPVVMQSFTARLRELKSALDKSDFFATHEFIGSSLLFLHDESLRAGVWMIDFAKTLPRPGRLLHTVPWTPGSHEDGYLLGLGNLIQATESAAAEYV